MFQWSAESHQTKDEFASECARFHIHIASLYFNMVELEVAMPEPILQELLKEKFRILMKCTTKPASHYTCLFMREYAADHLIRMAIQEYPAEWIVAHPVNFSKIVSIAGNPKHDDYVHVRHLKHDLFLRMVAPIPLNMTERQSMDAFLKEKCGYDAGFLKSQWAHWSKENGMRLSMLIEQCMVFLPFDFEETANHCESMLVGYQQFQHVRDWITAIKVNGVETSPFVPSLCEYGQCLKTTIQWNNVRETIVYCFKCLHPQTFQEHEMDHPMFPSERLACFYKESGKEEVQFCFSPFMGPIMSPSVKEVHVYGEDVEVGELLPTCYAFTTHYHVVNDPDNYLFCVRLTELPSNGQQKRKRPESVKADDPLICPICRDHLSRNSETVLFAECRHVFCKSCIDGISGRRPQTSDDYGMKECPSCRKYTFVQKLFFA